MRDLDVDVFAAVLTPMFGKRARKTQHKIRACRVLAAVTLAITGIDPCAIAFGAEKIRFRNRSRIFFFRELFYSLLHNDASIIAC